MKAFIAIFLGGGLGSLARYSLAKWVGSLHAHPFPLGTLAVNVAACLLVGLLIGWADQRQGLSASMRLFWVVGFCGGFSTFSAFSHEALALYQSGQGHTMLLYVAASLVLCLLATFGGLALAAK